MKKQMQISMLVVAFAMIGCQKSAEQGSSSAASEAVAGLQSVCKNGPTTNPEIIGASGLKSGQKATLSLSSSVNCDAAEKAQWKIGNTIIGTGSQVQALIVGSGIYNVSVVLGADSGSSQNKTTSAATVSSVVGVTNAEILIVGPQLGVEDQDNQFSLTVPAGTQLTQANWDFGDGAPLVSSLNPVVHAFSRGTYTVTVNTVDANNVSQTLTQNITVIPLPEGRLCPLDQLAIAGPTDVPVGRSVGYSVNISDCLKTQVTQVVWNFGDGTNPVTALSSSHSFTQVGSYTINAQITVYGNVVNLTRVVTVSDDLENMPGPVPDPTTDPNQCSTAGETRVNDGSTVQETVACGLNGTKTNTYKNQTTQTCQSVDGVLKWVDSSTAKILVTEGACQSQSCELTTAAGKETLKDGESRTLYTSQTPAGACSTVQQVRTCSNGVLSGSETAQYSSCHSGCGEFGIHGTVKTSVVTGEIQQPVTCQFGETGVVSIFNQVADMTCQDGQVITSNTHQGDIKTAGICPTYTWTATETFSQCSADCGGTQNRVYECRNNSGVVSPSERCGTQMPQESRLCDGNPEAVKRSESSTTQEEAPSCAACPKNQIGVVVETRDVTVTKNYACLNHQIQVASTQTTNGAWVKESYCRDFVPMRCSQDSLSNSDAKGRYDWMKKCEDKIPAVKEFLTNFEDVVYKENKTSTGYGINGTTRLLYPTFMSTDTKKPWIAPKVKTAECTAPAHIYVAAVCVSSCATPEQQILVEAKNEKKFKYMTFLDALTQNVPKVGALHSASSISDRKIGATKVDNWVTEMLDGEHQILIFKMKSGGALKVTLNHPLLTPEGVMKQAADFSVGESLVQLGGIPDQILSIEQTVHTGKVYNLFVKSNDPRQNVVVTNGYLNGTAFFQNEGAQNMNRALFRTNLTRGALDSKGKK